MRDEAQKALKGVDLHVIDNVAARKCLGMLGRPDSVTVTFHLPMELAGSCDVGRSVEDMADGVPPPPVACPMLVFALSVGPHHGRRTVPLVTLPEPLHTAMPALTVQVCDPPPLHFAACVLRHRCFGARSEP